MLLLLLTWFNATPTNVLATTEPLPYPETQTNRYKTDTKIFGIIRRATDWVLGGGNDNPGAPSDRRRGGATRDQCPPSPIRLTALVPSSDADLSRQATKTIAEHPVFWFYVPFSNQLDRRWNLF
ncbi:MAG: DUF928 domain-containing protein [Leptolyngbyaceae cyanobacterium SL_7_1]|nr:DUF928 domain-containing protein [Leptolyngbyaceae cyanobacterium SL_7_1]